MRHLTKRATTDLEAAIMKLTLAGCEVIFGKNVIRVESDELKISEMFDSTKELIEYAFNEFDEV